MRRIASLCCVLVATPAAAAAVQPDIFCWNLEALISLAPTKFVALKGERRGDVYLAGIQMPFSDVECAIDGELYTCGVDYAKFGAELKRCIGTKSKVSVEDYGLFVTTEYRVDGVLLTLDDDGVFEVGMDVAPVSPAQKTGARAKTTPPAQNPSPPGASERSGAAPSGARAK